MNIQENSSSPQIRACKRLRTSPWFFFLLAFSPRIEKGPSKQSLVTVSFSPVEMPLLEFFFPPSASAIYDLHAVFSQVLCSIRKGIESWKFSSLFFSPGNCTNPLSVLLFPRGWVIYYPDPAGQISKNLTQNEQLSVSLSDGHRILNNSWWMGKKQERKMCNFYPVLAMGDCRQRILLFFSLKTLSLFIFFIGN